MLDKIKQVDKFLMDGDVIAEEQTVGDLADIVVGDLLDKCIKVRWVDDK